MLQSCYFVRGHSGSFIAEPLGSQKVTQQTHLLLVRRAFLLPKTPPADLCLPQYAEFKNLGGGGGEEGLELRERQTFLSGQLYFSKTSSYICVAPSVTSIIAWLHKLPRPVRLNCKKTGKGESETQTTAERMPTLTRRLSNAVIQGFIAPKWRECGEEEESR